jgi:hypothetical protein
MRTKHILKKQLALLPCRYILGVIGLSKELSPKINPVLIEIVQNKVGRIEEILPAQDFPNPPESYIREIGEGLFSTIIIILQDSGAYTWLHHIKNRSKKVEEKLVNSQGGRIFNINPGAVGTYGVCLASHKPTGDRPDLSVYAYGLHPHLFFGEDSYYERIMTWDNDRLELTGRALMDGKFPEYAETSRVERFEKLVRTLPKSDMSIELMLA